MPRYYCVLRNQGSFVKDDRVEAIDRAEALKKFLEEKIRYESKDWNQVEIQQETS
jgi:hypothetical protein